MQSLICAIVATFAVSATCVADARMMLRLTSNEIIGLAGVCRVESRGPNAIRVVMASGSNLDLADPQDVRAVHSGLDAMHEAGRISLLALPDRTTINLSQTSTVWFREGKLTFWGVNGDGWALSDADAATALWNQLSQNPPASAPFIQVTPALMVNQLHVQHVSTVDGRLRVLMSNKTWPIIDATDEAAAREALSAAATPTR